MKKIGLLIAVVASSFAYAEEFYKLDLSSETLGTDIVKVDANGKQIANRKTWGMWPRTANSVGAKVIEFDGQKALEVMKGFQVSSSEWDITKVDSQQSIVYARFQIVVKSDSEIDAGLVGSVAFQQINNRMGAFIGITAKKGVLAIDASNGDGKGFVKWQNVASIKANEKVTVDVKMNFATKTYDVTVGDKSLKDNKFRHADQWVGSMWAESTTNKACRYDVSAILSNLVVTELEFSADEFTKGN